MSVYEVMLLSVCVWVHVFIPNIVARQRLGKSPLFDCACYRCLFSSNSR
jgi:hypothetical protein